MTITTATRVYVMLAAALNVRLDSCSDGPLLDVFDEAACERTYEAFARHLKCMESSQRHLILKVEQRITGAP